MDELKERLEKSIKLLKYRIKQFDEEKMATEEGNVEYNQLLIKKAVMSQKLNSYKDKRLNCFFPKFMRKIKGETLICDRF